MELELIKDTTPEKWDEAIEAYHSHCLFHKSAWLRFIEETQGAKTLRFRITEGGRTEGYFVGLTIKKGPLRIMGSPLPGWTTDYMGPVINKGFDLEKFLDALDAKCHELKVHHIELCSHVLPPRLMQNKGYEIDNSSTFIVPLTPDKDVMWNKLERRCRQNIRKAMSNNLVVETCDDPAFADEYYAELVDVFARQRLVPSYSAGRVRSLLEVLRGSVLSLRIKNGDKTIATGVFPYDNRSAYIFGAASWRKFQGLYPNELLYWTAMDMFAKKGIPQLDMCGDGSFKPKFGAKEVPVYKYAKSYNVSAKLGRKVYQTTFRVKQALSGRLSLLVPRAA